MKNNTFCLYVYTTSTMSEQNTAEPNTAAPSAHAHAAHRQSTTPPDGGGSFSRSRGVNARLWHQTLPDSEGSANFPKETIRIETSRGAPLARRHSNSDPQLSPSCGCLPGSAQYRTRGQLRSIFFFIINWLMFCMRWRTGTIHTTSNRDPTARSTRSPHRHPLGTSHQSYHCSRGSHHASSNLCKK